MGKLTKAQTAELRRIAESGVPASFHKNGFTANPVTSFDGRLIPALERQGLIECFTQKWFSINELANRYTPCVRVTEAGRLALKEHGDE